MDTGELVMKNGTFKGTLNTDKDINVGAEIYMHAREDGVASGSVWSDIRAVDKDGNNLPAQITIRHILISNIARDTLALNTGIGYVRAETEGTSGQAILYGDSNNNITVGTNGCIFKINGKKGLTGTYIVKKSITTEAGLVTEVD